MKVLGILILWQHCMFLISRRPERTSHSPRNNVFASITKNSGIKSNIKPPPPPATVILDAHTFDDVVFVSSLATFIYPVPDLDP